MKILVAGVGNVFLGDDGFGVETLQRLRAHSLPEDVRLMDVGIRGVHLAYELLEGYDALVLLDAMVHDETPGTVSILERSWSEVQTAFPAHDAADVHDMAPDGALAMLASLGGRVDRVFTVGCEPERVEEHLGLSSVVAGAVEPAADAARCLVERILESSARTGSAADRPRTKETSECFDAFSRPPS